MRRGVPRGIFTFRDNGPPLQPAATRLVPAVPMRARTCVEFCSQVTALPEASAAVMFSGRVEGSVAIQLPSAPNSSGHDPDVCASTRTKVAEDSTCGGATEVFALASLQADSPAVFMARIR